MSSFSNSTRSNGEIDSSSQDKSIESDASGNFYKNLKNKANSFPIEKILEFYLIRVDPYSGMTRCPFLFHKGGKEGTPSFKIFKDTNSFYCYGCGTGGKVVNFISEFENISKTEAAIKIIDTFSSDYLFDNNLISDIEDSEKLETLIDFSNFMRNCVKTNLTENNLKKIEEISYILDLINETKNWKTDALKEVVIILKQKIRDVKCQNSLF